MKKPIWILILAFGVLLSCNGATDFSQLSNVSIDTKSIVDLVNPENQELIAGLNPGEALVVVAALNETESESSETPSPYLSGWVYLLDKNSNIIYSTLIESIDTVNSYNTQNLLMNELGDTQCPCTVVIGTYVPEE